MLIGSTIIYISYMFIKEEIVLNNEVIIKEIKVNNITKNLVKIAVVFYLLALLFII